MSNIDSFNLNYWYIYLKNFINQFKLVSKKIKTNSLVKKQLYEKCPKSMTQDEFDSLNSVFELNLSSNDPLNICILDFDCRDKNEQKHYFETNNLSQMLANLFNDHYVESSFNGGVHVIIKTSEKFTITNNIYNTIGQNLILEFKNVCLVAPSVNYQVLNLPCTDKTCSVEDIFLKLNSFLKELNSLEPDLLSDTYLKLAPPPIDEEELTELNKKIPKNSKKRKTDSEFLDDSKKRNINDNQREYIESIKRKLSPFDDDHSDEGKKRKFYSTTVKDTFDLINQYSIEHLSKPIFPTENRVELNLDEFEKTTKKIELIKNVIENVMKWAKSNAENESKISDVFFNYSMNIQTLIVSLDRHINDLEKVGERIYFSSIDRFILNLQMADKSLNNMDMLNNEKFESIFHTLENTKLWFEWTYSYCKLIINIRDRSYTSGKYSLIDFDDYSTNRYVTLLNRKGFMLSEQAAKQEYKEIYSKVLTRTNYFRHNPANLWFEFIMITLKSIEINRLSLDALSDFNQYFTRSHKKSFDLEWAMRSLFQIKLKNIPYSISSIYDDSFQGKKIKTTVIYIAGLHKMKVNGEVFIKFLHTCFPDHSNSSINEIIQGLNNISENNGVDVETQSWFNCFPWLNGVIDFKPNYSAQIHNPIKNNRFLFGNETNSNKDSITRSENSRRGTISKEYLESLKRNEIQSKIKKDYRQVEVEKNDENYEGFSVFRNYTNNDQVFDPIDDLYNHAEYLNGFESTDLLSLENEARYEIFPLFIRSFFGDKPDTGYMDCFHLQNFLFHCTYQNHNKKLPHLFP
jgi:hypothetical protein